MLQNDEKSVLIAIQARSTSTRFPGKIFERIGDQTALQRVVSQAISAQKWVQNTSRDIFIRCATAVLFPEHDTEVRHHCKSLKVYLIGGDENDVLSRYITALKQIKPDYIVRITADCPMILDYMISKHINVACRKNLDYLSNVDEQCRTIADGFDCEILSRKALEWLDKNAISAEDREHVTTALRRLRPKELRMGFVPSKIDTSSWKMSLDTPEDLENIRKYHHDREYKMAVAKSLYGEDYIYEL